MSNTLKKKDILVEKAKKGEADSLKLIKQESGFLDLGVPEIPQASARELKSVNITKNENHRLGREKGILLDQLSKINIDVENKKNELEYAKALMEDKIGSKQLVIIELESQELQYKNHIERLSKEVSILKIDLEDNERRLKTIKYESNNRENKLKSNYLNIQKKISDSEKNIEGLNSKINGQEKKLLSIGLIVKEKEASLADLNKKLKTLQQFFNTLKLKYETLIKDHAKVSNVIEELENYEKDLIIKKDLAQEKLYNEIERDKLRYDIERQTQFKNLNSKLVLRERDWEEEHSRRNQKREKKFDRYMDEKELEFKRKIQQTEIEVFEIQSRARKESTEIRESSEKILKDAYAERQRLLDEGSQEKMKAMAFVEDQVQASQLSAEKIRLEASNKLREAQEHHTETELNSKKLLDSARTKGEAILRKADIRKRSLLRNAQIENEQITKKLKNEEIQFLATIEKRKIRLNNYLQIKRERVLQNIEDNNKIIKGKEEKLRLKLLDENEKIKRKELKKVVLLKDQVIKKVNESFELEKLKLKKLRKKELEDLYKERKEVLTEISELKDQSVKKHKDVEREHRKYLAQKEKVGEKINAERKEELELEFSKRLTSKVKEIEDLQKENSLRLKTQITDYVSELIVENEIGISSAKVKSEMNSIFQNSFEHKKDKLLKNSGQKSSELKSKNINSFMTKYVYKMLVPVSILLFFVFNGLGSKDIVVSLGQKVYQVVKESSKSSEALILKEEQDKKIFSPKLTVGFKQTYVDNILYTKNFLSTYESDQFQNDWLLAAYGFISDELELSEEVAIKFISTEGAFIRELSEARAKIDARFSNESISKMRKVELSAFNSQVDQFKTIENWKAFQAYRNNFFTEKF